MAAIDLPDAELIIASVNELALDQKPSETDPGQPKHDDPVALRFGAWARPLGRLKYYIGKVSLDALRWKDGRKHRTEVGFVKLAVDDLFDGDGRPLPMVALFLTDRDDASQDADMQPVAVFTRRGIRFLAPVFGMSTGSAPARVSRFYTDGGKFLVNWQDDQDTVRAVIYRVFRNADGTEHHVEALGERQFWP